MPYHFESSRSAEISLHWGRQTRFWFTILAIFALAFILFEVGIRHVPPDGMTVTLLSPDGRSSGPWMYTTPKDQQTIDAYYTGLNAAPVKSSQVFANYALFHGCYPTAYPQITFTWHGIPIESWTSQDSVSICAYVEDSGGLSENLTGTFHLWFPYHAMPLPASQ